MIDWDSTEVVVLGTIPDDVLQVVAPSHAGTVVEVHITPSWVARKLRKREAQRFSEVSAYTDRLPGIVAEPMYAGPYQDGSVTLIGSIEPPHHEYDRSFYGLIGVLLPASPGTGPATVRTLYLRNKQAVRDDRSRGRLPYPVDEKSTFWPQRTGNRSR